MGGIIESYNKKYCIEVEGKLKEHLSKSNGFIHAEQFSSLVNEGKLLILRRRIHK